MKGEQVQYISDLGLAYGAAEGFALNGDSSEPNRVIASGWFSRAIPFDKNVSAEIRFAGLS